MEEELLRMFHKLTTMEKVELLADLNKRTATASQQAAAPTKA